MDGLRRVRRGLPLWREDINHVEPVQRHRTMLTNALRAHLAAPGIVAAQGSGGLSSLKSHFRNVRDELQDHAAVALNALIRQADELAEQVGVLERRP